MTIKGKAYSGRAMPTASFRASGFSEVYTAYERVRIEEALNAVNDADIERAVAAESLTIADFMSLLAPLAAQRLELLARRSQETTLRHFGRVILLYAPLYLANYCDNECVYCGFKHSNEIKRRRLTPAEVEKEGAVISSAGIRQLLVLSGESRGNTSVSYLKECLQRLRKHFAALSIEVYPLEEGEYRELIGAGADGLTLYQETYDRPLYAKLHSRGPKRDFFKRLEAPERACRAGMRAVNVGALLGLSAWRRDVFFAGLHADHLQRAFPDVEVSVSLPRIQPEGGGFRPQHPVSDAELVQAMAALRLFLPRAGITISTREPNEFRANLIGLGVTRMSAGSRTEVGGYACSDATEGQFRVADTSGVEEVKAMVRAKGYQPVMKDWEFLEK